MTTTDSTTPPIDSAEAEDQTVQHPAAPDLKPGQAYEGETEADKVLRQAAIREAYSKAQTKLRLDHLVEFNGLVHDEAEKLGYDWAPPLTKAEKAKAALLKLIEDNPELAESVEVKA